MFLEIFFSVGCPKCVVNCSEVLPPLGRYEYHQWLKRETLVGPTECHVSPYNLHKGCRNLVWFRYDNFDYVHSEHVLLFPTTYQMVQHGQDDPLSMSIRSSSHQSFSPIFAEPKNNSIFHLVVLFDIFHKNKDKIQMWQNTNTTIP